MFNINHHAVSEIDHMQSALFFVITCDWHILSYLTAVANCRLTVITKLRT